MHFRAAIPRFVFFAATVLMTAAPGVFGEEAGAPPPKVDFSYAFATPHRMTLGRPEVSDRTLLDLQPGSLRMAWTYDNLSMPNFPPLSFRTPPTLWNIQITLQIDGKPLAKSRWTRLDGVLPGLENVYEDPACAVRLEAIGGATAALVRIEIANTAAAHQVVLRCDSGAWGENPAWLDPAQNVGDHLLAGWNDRADRVLILGIGADAYSLEPDGLAPGPKGIVLVWNLKPGEKRTGWLVRPYHGYAADLPELRKRDWAPEMEQGKKEWHDLLARAPKVTVPDADVTNAYLACLGDLFIMREPLSNGQIASVPGTEGYRAGNSGEAAIVAVALDQTGFHKEAAAGYRVSLEMQGDDGNWADPRGWMHRMWCASGFKCWTIMEHYRLTGDKNFLAEIYPRMRASSRWQETQRATMRPAGAERPLAYGLMPRGFGDCGLMNDSDLYGVFIPHNIWAVYADRCSLEAAEILGKSEDVAELKKIYETARDDLLSAIDRGAIVEKDYRWIPGVPGKTCGSTWGALNVAFPCGLLPPDHPLVTGTLRHMESRISPGGIPIHTGWLADGMWVAITLDNLAEVHLTRGNGDAAAKYFYATLNHGTPLYTWCEERGQEPGSTNCTGDRQHLWTPLAVVRCLRDMLVMESGDGVNLALGTPRHWLASGKPVGIAAAPTHFGPVSYQMQYDAAHSRVTGELRFAEDSTAAWAVLHVRLPEGLRVTAVDPESKAAVLPDGSGLRWTAPRGVLKFQATVGRGG
ncbi:MAG: hypothetical protein NTW96_13205 [Planctomycetia bacterium]|nr:hypothetical protein [Planctomycetia bacterium]